MQILNQKTEVIPIDAVKPHPDNPHKGDLPVIRESIENNGFYGSVIVQKSTGFILAGNHRYLAALETGAKEIPVTWIDVEDDQAARIMLADNRTSDLGSYDDEILSNLLESLKESTGTLLGTGYDDGVLDELLNSFGQNQEGIDETNVLKDQYQILVECKSESEQLSYLEKIESLGIECKALVS